MYQKNIVLRSRGGKRVRLRRKNRRHDKTPVFLAFTLLILSVIVLATFLSKLETKEAKVALQHTEQLMDKFRPHTDASSESGKLQEVLIPLEPETITDGGGQLTNNQTVHIFERVDPAEPSADSNPSFQAVQLPPEPAAENNLPNPSLQTADEWSLRLVNSWSLLPKDYTISLTQLKNGLSVDSRCYPALQEMMDACRADGLSPVICSAYRTWEKQKSLFQNKVSQLLAQGYSEVEAAVEAGKEVAVPGTSEHQLGLAVDIVDINNQLLDKSQENTVVQKWLMEHSWEYGFILRYPNDKSSITGIIYEPWHYRYVGLKAAKEIHEQGIYLEEYLGN